MGVEKIMCALEYIDHLPVMDLFLSIEPWRLRRPCGEIYLLVGIGMAEIFPYLQDPKLHRKKNLRVLTSQLGSGFLLDGRHRLLKPMGGAYCHVTFEYS